MLSLEAAYALLKPGHAPVYTFNDVEHCYDITYSAAQRKALETIPFSADTLRECAGTHMLFPSFPLNLAQLKEPHYKVFADDRGWMIDAEKEPCARRPLRVTRNLLRLKALPFRSGTTRGMTYEQQLALLHQDESCPSAALLMFAIVLHGFTSLEPLYTLDIIRTSDVCTNGERLCL